MINKEILEVLSMNRNKQIRSSQNDYRSCPSSFADNSANVLQMNSKNYLIFVKKKSIEHYVIHNVRWLLLLIKIINKDGESSEDVKSRIAKALGIFFTVKIKFGKIAR